VVGRTLWDRGDGGSRVEVSAVGGLCCECSNKEHKGGPSAAAGSGGWGWGTGWLGSHTFSNCRCQLMKADAERLV